MTLRKTPPLGLVLVVGHDNPMERALSLHVALKENKVQLVHDMAEVQKEQKGENLLFVHRLGPEPLFNQYHLPRQNNSKKCSPKEFGQAHRRKRKKQ